jgi:hypothetical protein
MDEYRSIRLWQLRPGASASELEELMTSGMLEMQRWIPGVKGLTLIRLAGEYPGHFVVITTFTDYAAYQGWRRVEEEGPDYWERYASVLMHWEQLVELVEEYHGEVVTDITVL